MTPDLAQLQGRWKVTSLEVGGSNMPVSMFPNAGVSVTGDVFESTGMGAVYRGRLTLAETAGRKTFSLAFEDGPEKGNVNNALYELDGDRWTLCIDMKGGPAPRAFSSSAANGYALETLMRL
jgi:uncharacterized protein (TIGR03067 family)